jgi:TatD DNase family protein
MYTDSHLHFDTFDEAGEVDQVIARAQQAGVRTMIAIGGSAEANRRAARLAASCPGVYATVGFDRDEAGKNPDVSSLTGYTGNARVVGIGETGLDYHYGPDTAPQQMELFQQMLDLAHTHRLPVVVHNRDSDDDMLRMLTAHAARWGGDPERIGVLHCYTGDDAFAARLVELGFYIGFSGILTFKNADSLRQVAAGVPPDRMLIETDAPYLAPIPHRGKRNEPAMVVHVAEALAAIRDDTVEHIADTTTQNAARLFGLNEDHAQ